MSNIWITIFLAGAGTYAMRASFIVTAHRLTSVPPWGERILRQIPPAALASLVLPALVRPEGEVDLTQPRLWVGLVAGLVAWRTRSVLLTLVVGLGGLMAVEAII